MNSINPTSFFNKDEHIAVIGVSKNTKKFGRIVFDTFKKKGYRVVPVNPLLKKTGEDICYNSVESLPDNVTKALILTKPEQTDKILYELAKKGINDVWIQQMSNSKNSFSIADELKINAVFKHCCLMFAEPVIPIVNM